MNLFIDTNVFLSFYHLSNDDLEEIHKLTVLIEKREVTLWLTEQVKDEFKRNRENKISEAMKKLKEQKTKPQFPQICKDYEEYPEIRELQKQYSQKLSSLTKKVTDDVTGSTLKADQKIKELFAKSKVIETTNELVAKARFRMDVRNPPGKDGSLGDAINWEGLLESVEDNQKLYLIADDKDYYSVLDEYKLKEFLSDEWKDKKSEEVVFYRRLSQFFKDHYPDIKLATELEKELAIRNLVNSGNFANTHSAISKLSKYAEFNKSQVNELVQICFTNDQVGWIIGDDDVEEFYKSLLDNHGDVIEDELKLKLEEALKPAGSDDDDA
ncbi:PIN domain-containing protein [Pseudoalteromonas sp. EB27]|uniref:PIN domain-containing protein n=1 Tax=Pseudoalteromonas sp. EB27 TaxID=1938368 RepID=UPI000977E17E|nr:PIN domain-containing protein [Pseudoalteromonas sp. EB27]